MSMCWSVILTPMALSRKMQNRRLVQNGRVCFLLSPFITIPVLRIEKYLRVILSSSAGA